MTKSKAQTSKQRKALLANWNTMNGGLMKLPEDEVRALLDEEKRGLNRLTFTLRLHARLSKLRRERERRELAGS